MAELQLEVKETIETPIESVSLKGKRHIKQVAPKLEKVELSDNIKKFDKRPRTDPFSFNAISLKKANENKVKLVPSAEQMVTDPLYNSVGKVLGIDTKKEWNIYSDKIFTITQWIKTKYKLDTADSILRTISNLSTRVPSMGVRRIDDIYIYTKLHK